MTNTLIAAATAVTETNMAETVLLNFVSIMVYVLLFSLSEGYALGLTMENFFTNKIANAEKRQMDLDNKESDIKVIIERLRYRATGGLWKLIFKIFCFPGWLVGTLINLIAKGLTNLIFFLFLEKWVSRGLERDGEGGFHLWDFATKLLISFTSIIKFGLHLAVYSFVSYIAADCYSFLGQFTFFGLIEDEKYLGAVLLIAMPVIVTFIQMVIYTGMLCPNMMKIGFIEKLSDKMDDAGEMLYKKYGYTSTLHSIIVGGIQNIISSVSDFLRSITVWAEFTVEFKWLIIFVPLVLLIAFINAQNGSEMNIFSFVNEKIGVVDNLIGFVKGWLTLFVLKVLLVKFPSTIMRVLKPQTYVKLLQKTEKVSVSCLGVVDKIDNNIMKTYSSSSKNEFSKKTGNKTKNKPRVVVDTRSSFEKYRKHELFKSVATAEGAWYRINTNLDSFKNCSKDDLASILRIFYRDLSKNLNVDDNGIVGMTGFCTDEELFAEIKRVCEGAYSNLGHNYSPQEAAKKYAVCYALMNICDSNVSVDKMLDKMVELDLIYRVNEVPF